MLKYRLIFEKEKVDRMQPLPMWARQMPGRKLLAATEKGLGGCMIGSFNAGRVAEEFE